MLVVFLPFLIPAGVELGSAPYQMIIGDSQALLIAATVPDLHCPSKLSGEGWGTDRLLKAVEECPTYWQVERLYVVIGTNDGYKKSKVPALAAAIKEAFPNAEIIYIPGSYGWGRVAQVPPEALTDYAKAWAKQGCAVHPTGIGFTPRHPGRETEGVLEVCAFITTQIQY